MALSVYLREGINAAIIMAAGDALAQLAVEKKELKNYDIGRTARFGAIGLVLVGPALRRWYITLDKVVKREQPKLQRSLKKMALDQTIFAPPFTLLLSYLVPFVNGSKHDDIVKQIRKDYFTVMKNSYMLWPLAQIVNFTVVPMQYQVMYVQFIAVIWNTYLSNKLLNK